MRIASLSPAVTEVLFALGEEKDIVCSDQFSDWPEEARKLPHIKGHQEITAAALKPFDPGAIFTSTLVQKKLAEELKKNEKWAVVWQDPRTLAEVYESIKQIGLIIEKEKEAAVLVKTMELEMQAVQKKAKLLPRKAKVYVEEWHNPPMASGNWVPDIVRAAGGIGFPLESRAPSREVSLAEIAVFNPDMIVLSICGAGRFAEKRLLTGRDGWKDLPAVAKGNVFVIDDSLLNRPGPRLVDGAKRLFEWMFQVMH